VFSWAGPCPFSHKFRMRLIEVQSLKCTFDTPESADKMRVFVQPMEWDEREQGPRPIRRLDVFAKNYIAGQEMRGPRAVGTSADDVQCWSFPFSFCILWEKAVDVMYAQGRFTGQSAPPLTTPKTPSVY
jgi:hypothetical protein